MIIFLLIVLTTFVMLAVGISSYLSGRKHGQDSAYTEVEDMIEDLMDEHFETLEGLTEHDKRDEKTSI